jgi:hypothetical protein
MWKRTADRRHPGASLAKGEQAVIKIGFARGVTLLAAFAALAALAGVTGLSAQASCGGARYTALGLVMGNAMILDQLTGTIYRCTADGYILGSCNIVSRIPA